MSFFKNTIFEFVRSVKYTSGGGRGYEQAIRRKLIEGKLIEVAAKSRPNETQILNGWFTKDPKGANQAPDFRIGRKGRSFELEVKTKQNEKDSTIMWNGGRPRANTVYHFANPGNEFTFMGRDYPDIFKNEKIDEACQEFKRKADEVNLKIKEVRDAEPSAHPVKESVYCRLMYVQKTHLHDLPSEIFREGITVAAFLEDLDSKIEGSNE